MIENYFKTTWRSVKRHRTYSILNILGLALGITSCLIIFLVVKYELGYDGFNKKADRIYRVTLHALDYNPGISMAVAPALRTSFPELEQVSQVWYQNDGMVTVGQSRYIEKGYAFADAQFTKIFDYEWLRGDAGTALAEPNSIVLTESMAKKYFGGKDPMGQIINLDNTYNLKVTGLIKDLPGNTHLPFLFLVSFETVKQDAKRFMSQFYAIVDGSFAYILLPSDYSVQQLQKRIPSFIAANWGKDIAKDATVILQPLKEIHFDQRYLQNGINIITSKETYWALSAVAIFIIIIACINFINLATAQAVRRAKEIGVRKVLGSNRSQLIGQFLGETALMVMIALLLALVATVLFLPKAAQWLDIKIGIGQLISPSAITMICSITITMILLAGLYPALVQSKYNPIYSLKSQAVLPFRGLTMRKILVVVQFAISQIMIVGTLVVAFQMDFFKNRDLGFDKDAVISFNLPDRSKNQVLRQELLAHPGVKELSFASGAPAYNSSYTDFLAPESGITKNDVTEMKFIDDKYTDMFQLKMLAGEKIRKTNENDSIKQVVVNESLMHKLNIANAQEAIGKHFILNGWHATITGVVQDFQSESKHKKRRPCALLYSSRENMVCVKLNPSNMQHTIAVIDKLWSSMFPEGLFQYEFLDEHIASWYRQEEKQYTAFKLFSAIAILIGCLGLYGLVAFAAAQRTKEVGVRKVLGASLKDIVLLFSKEFALLIVVAFLIASPVAYYAMHKWLENFAYQINIGAGIFIIAIIISFAIAGFTIAYQAVKAAVVNPVKSLRTE